MARPLIPLIPFDTHIFGSEEAVQESDSSLLRLSLNMCLGAAVPQQNLEVDDTQITRHASECGIVMKTLMVGYLDPRLVRWKCMWFR